MDSYLDSIAKLNSRIKTCDQILCFIGEKFYSIGLSHFRFGHQKRGLIYNPFLVLVVCVIIIIRDIVSCLAKDQNISIILGDMAFNWQLKNMWYSQHIIFLSMTPFSQAIHLYFYMKKFI